MIDVRYYRNVAELMGVEKPLPKPQMKCTLHDDQSETLEELQIIHISGKDGDYYDNNNNGIFE